MLKPLSDWKAAIEAIFEAFSTGDEGADRYIAEKILANVPSAQPKTGKWIDYSDEGYVECPFCHSATNCDGNKDELHFCFSCGADLRGEQDDSISD